MATGQVIAEPIGRNDPATFTGFLHRLEVFDVAGGDVVGWVPNVP